MMRRRTTGQGGDTIVEVLIAIVIMGAMLSAAFATMNKTTINARQAQERGEALKLVEAQAERVRLVNNFIPDAPLRLFCVNDANATVDLYSSGTNTPPLPDLYSDNFGLYNNACQQKAVENGIVYHISIEQFADRKFTFRARWDRLGGGRDEALVIYRIPKIVLQSSRVRTPTNPPVECGLSRQGDGYSPTIVGSNIYSAWHHYDEVVIRWFAIDLSDCGEMVLPGYITGYHSRLVSVSGRLYFTAERISDGKKGFGCFDPSSGLFCSPAFAPIPDPDASSNMQTALGASADGNNFDGSIDNIVVVGGRLYSFGLTASGRLKVFCANTDLTTCGSYDTGRDVSIGGNLDFWGAGAYVSGSRIVYNALQYDPGNPTSIIGCVDVSNGSIALCSGWADEFMTNVANITLIPIEASDGTPLVCLVHVQPDNARRGCWRVSDGQAAGVPGGFMANWPLSNTAVDGNQGFILESLRIADRIYTAVHNNVNRGYMYCYDLATNQGCRDFGIDNGGLLGWQDGSTNGNFFSDYKPYAVAVIYSNSDGCLYGIGDEVPSGKPSLFTLNPDNGTYCRFSGS